MHSHWTRHIPLPCDGIQIGVKMTISVILKANQMASHSITPTLYAAAILSLLSMHSHLNSTYVYILPGLTGVYSLPAVIVLLHVTFIFLLIYFYFFT